MCVLYSRSTDEDRRTRLVPWWLDNTVRVAACDHHRAAGHCRAARCWALPERIMHNDMYQVMFGPSSAGNGGRGRIAAGSAVAGSAVLRRLTASRVPEGVRRHGVARIDDAQSLCVYDVWPSSARSAAAGSAAAGGAAAGGVAAGRMAASRVSAGVRRSGVARNNDDAKLDDVYNVCAIIGKERGIRGERRRGLRWREE